MTLYLEVGKNYRDRAGAETGPLIDSEQSTYPFWSGVLGRSFTQEGRYIDTLMSSDYDLVEEVPAETVQPESIEDALVQMTPEVIAEDEVNSPSHYKQGDIECIDAIKAALTPEEWRGYCKGNCLKYVWRERYKQQDTALAKAQWYLNRLLGVK